MTNKLILPGAVEAALAEQEAVDAAKKAMPDLADKAVNPHDIKLEELQQYQQHHWPLVLKHGRKKFGICCLILATNGAMNHLGEIGQRHNCHRQMLPAMECLVTNFGNLFEELSTLHKWTADELRALQGEITRSELKEGTPTLVSASGGPLH